MTMNLPLLFSALGVLLAAIALWPAFYQIWKARRDRMLLNARLRRGLFDLNTILNATKYFVRTKCSNLDPSQEKELRHALVATREDLFKNVDKFISEETDVNHLLVLADSGTGKTTFVLNYYVYNETAGSRYNVAIVPLGHRDADKFIEEVPEKEDTVIFLDALDEDTRAIEDHQARIAELVERCRPFRRLVMTCRTQFFRRDEEIPKDTGIVRLGPRSAGESGTYRFRKIYLSPFDDDDVKAYLEKRYPIWCLSKRKAAMEIAMKVPLLSARPMLLAHIPDLVEREKRITYVHELYEVMVEAWLVRESGWVEKQDLREFSERLAMDIHVNRQKRGMERVPGGELAELADRWRINLSDWQISGRSLLNRDADGNYKFAHRSIMEFLFICRFLSMQPSQRPDVEWSEQMKSFLLDIIAHRPEKLDLCNADLSHCDIQGQAGRVSFSGVRLNGAKIRDNGLGMTFVFIPPGVFMMGSPADEIGRSDDELLHQVTLTKGFFMQTTPVTQRQWKMMMGGNPSHFKKAGEDCPVENVTYEDVMAFIQRMNEKNQFGLYRLPTEAEWEYACRGGTDTRYFFGNVEEDLDKAAWYDRNSGGKTHPVGLKMANDFGLFDMHGNVWEWCADWFGDYPQSSVTNPKGPETGGIRVLRGGSWGGHARDCRSAGRGRLHPVNRGSNVGFRLVRSLP